MQYEVELEEKKYIINVNKCSESDIDPTSVVIPIVGEETGEDISYEVARTEYDYCLHRSEKLDNKIYILLTVCAFLIGGVLGIVDDLIKYVKWPMAVIYTKNIFECAAWIGTGLELIIFALSIIILVAALRSIDIHRFDQTEILDRDMVYSEKKKVSKYICSLYSKCTQHNNEIISKRYKLSNMAIVLIAVGFILMIILRVLIYILVR